MAPPATMALARAAVLTLLLGVSALEEAEAVVAAKHAMYVWTDSFDAEAAHCNGVYPPDKDGDNGSCFGHSWDTAEARERLWSACTVPGREVTRILVSDVRSRVGNGGYSDADGGCDAALTAMLEEAHSRGIEVYGLFAASDAAFSERDMVGGLNDFNDVCGSTASGAYFDGAAVNNEHFTSVKGCDDATGTNEAAQLKFLDDLAATRDNAAPLPLHFSVSWNWDCCSCSSAGYVRRELTWNGATRSALEHMIDVADSVDVQVAWNTGPTMVSRSERPYGYWSAAKLGPGTSPTTAFYVLAYTNPNSDCRQSFAPHARGSPTAADDCSTGDRTEGGMFDAFSAVRASHSNAHGGIHYMGGVYSTGMAGWPKHSSVAPVAAPVAAPTPAPVITPAPPTPAPAEAADCSSSTAKNECNGIVGCAWTGSPRGGECGVEGGGGGEGPSPASAAPTPAPPVVVPSPTDAAPCLGQDQGGCGPATPCCDGLSCRGNGMCK